MHSGWCSDLVTFNDKSELNFVNNLKSAMFSVFPPFEKLDSLTLFFLQRFFDQRLLQRFFIQRVTKTLPSYRCSRLYFHYFFIRVQILLVYISRGVLTRWCKSNARKREFMGYRNR